MRFYRGCLLVVMSLGLAGCGGGGADASSCAGDPIVGTWTFEGDSSVTIAFDSTCNVISSAPCNVEGTFPHTTATSGTISVNVTESAGIAGCLATGTTSCTYAIDSSGTPTILGFDCGNGTALYDKQ